MIVLLVIYLLFIISYEHWAGTGTAGPIIYFAFQYGWVAALSLVLMFKQVHKLPYLFIAVIFAGLIINEVLCFDLTNLEYQEAVNGPGPVFGLTVITLALFILYQIIQWKRKSV